MNAPAIHPVYAAPHEAASEVWLGRLFVLGLLLLPLQFIQVGMAQPAHLWAIVVIGVMVYTKSFRVKGLEIGAYLFFIAIALVDTLLAHYFRIKAVEQIIKFVAVYPAFYLIGRMYGEKYFNKKLPYGYVFIFSFIAIQYLIQFFRVPVVYEAVGFMQNAIHGTFKERNWFAIYVFLLIYLLFLRSDFRFSSLMKFFGASILIALLSESKTVLIACGIAFMLHHRGHFWLKVLAIAAGTAFYMQHFGWELSGDLLRVRLQDERGLAFEQSIKLISENWTGYGFGFVEGYFSQLWFTIMGLGLGTNSIFSSPLDFMVIAGFAGLAFWFVFFAGVGTSSVFLLAPVAAWSLVNPLHQSEIVYLFAGFLTTWGLQRHAADRASKGAL
ncbi:hypothetical protein ACFDAU_10675 [Sulfuriferula sp. GW1]|uniref:hypothetical protein n=1 Tax=Sulfuriferula sp. GW1 TaxID=3345111 RepID=UPI0039B0B251